MTLLRNCQESLRVVPLHVRSGRVRRIQGLALESEGPVAAVGELCRVVPRAGGAGIVTEVVGCKGGDLTLLAYGSLQGIDAGAKVIALGAPEAIHAVPALLGRVIDGFGAALDGGVQPARRLASELRAGTNPLSRPVIDEVLETGVRVIDALLTLGRGQRIGIFAGSGVGKSSLLGMVARHAQADVNVVALVGERGREVREFIDRQSRAGGTRAVGRGGGRVRPTRAGTRQSRPHGRRPRAPVRRNRPARDADHGFGDAPGHGTARDRPRVR
jgi:flagellum-specific ATP synthase